MMVYIPIFQQFVKRLDLGEWMRQVVKRQRSNFKAAFGRPIYLKTTLKPTKQHSNLKLSETPLFAVSKPFSLQTLFSKNRADGNGACPVVLRIAGSRGDLQWFQNELSIVFWVIVFCDVIAFCSILDRHYSGFRMLSRYWKQEDVSSQIITATRGAPVIWSWRKLYDRAGAGGFPWQRPWQRWLCSGGRMQLLVNVDTHWMCRFDTLSWVVFFARLQIKSMFKGFWRYNF